MKPNEKVERQTHYFGKYNSGGSSVGWIQDNLALITAETLPYWKKQIKSCLSAISLQMITSIALCLSLSELYLKGGVD